MVRTRAHLSHTRCTDSRGVGGHTDAGEAAARAPTSYLQAVAVSLPLFSHCRAAYVEAELVRARVRIKMVARALAHLSHQVHSRGVGGHTTCAGGAAARALTSYLQAGEAPPPSLSCPQGAAGVINSPCCGACTPNATLVKKWYLYHYFWYVYHF